MSTRDELARLQRRQLDSDAFRFWYTKVEAYVELGKVKLTDAEFMQSIAVIRDDLYRGILRGPVPVDGRVSAVRVPVGILEQAGSIADESAERMREDTEQVPEFGDAADACEAFARKLYAAARGDDVDWNAEVAS